MVPSIRQGKLKGNMDVLSHDLTAATDRLLLLFEIFQFQRGPQKEGRERVLFWSHDHGCFCKGEKGQKERELREGLNRSSRAQ
uniref:Uncharacterized protein n=1 Tax=Utricularia reniformis TaxID=192314 RepID=A0A1Y0B0A6_9LAMI|nr:hypothetical protein AEK19_MT0545 [Utricularia reniformis]ART30801.1 hypothetical protein AEK19_MT0545 [Utricularia reniformis]